MANCEFSVVMVVGAGRGPLVAATLRAAETVQRKLTVYAVEKNPNAVITLRNRVADDAGWGGVTVVSCDMRFWEAPGGVLADILVSELLGSFGDNELSPECLDGAQRFLRPDGGISIPCDYTSFVAPVSTPKLWQQINGLDNKEKLETPYVVRLWNFVQLAPAQPCFKFTHPRWCATRGVGAAGTEGELSDNRRFGAIRFARQAVSSMVHGFAGFFESTLFGDQMISIHPPTHSPGMFSWFPLYFPLRTPVYVAEGEWIAFHIWRCVDERGAKVWYEWCVETATYTSPIHNPAGRACNIGL
jgi:protein arginine N-methyltransferase 5